jgi:hypothetical protein
MFWKITALVITLTAGIGAAGPPQRLTPPDVPLGLEAPEGRRLVLVGHAIGTQNYICAPAATATGVDWLFLGPQATVFDGHGQQILTHFLSRNPYDNDALHATWQHSRDTSVVWAAKIAGSSDPSYVEPGAVEWLLLEMTGVEAGPNGGRKLAGTTYLQRVHTVGGVKPPAGECTIATINARRLVPYEADYYFYE